MKWNSLFFVRRGTMFKRIICILAITAIISLLFTGCFIKKEPEPEPLSKERANEAAVTYLKEKYGEEFVSVGGYDRADSIVGGNYWYVDEIIKKSQENEGFPHKYEVSISDDNKYTILGDTVMFDYYNPLYEEYVTPIIKNEMNDIPFIITANFGTSLKFGVEAEKKIPVSPDDEEIVRFRGCFEFDIFIPASFDNDQIPEICKNIKERLTEDNYLRGFIILLSEEDYAVLSTAVDKYRAKETHSFSAIKSYRVE